MKKRKILIISTVGLIYDGITNVILSSLKAMDRSNLDIYIAATIASDQSMRKQFEALKCNIIDLPNRRTQPALYFLKLASFIRKNKIHTVHAHGNSGTLAIEMFASWLGGTKKRIAHSHNTKCNQKKADKLLRPLFNIFYTDAVACGYDAGKWLFGNRKFTVINNGRDIALFAYDAECRNEYRNKLKIKENEVAIGHVGGFFEQKNHDFLIKIFREIKKIEPNTKFFLIGDGPLRKKIEAEVADMNVCFIGTVNNVSDYLNAMDGMILPSLFEGLPLVAIEWQLNGLPILISDTVTRDCALVKTVRFMSLEQSAMTWAEAILGKIKENNREEASVNAQHVAIEKGFDVRVAASMIREMYLAD